MCPECGQPLVILEWQGVEIDYCLACGGTWLDRGEIELIAERAGVEAPGLTRAMESAPVRGEGKGRCPRCRKALEGCALSGSGGGGEVLLDRCPQGHGVWFDPGEVVAVLGAAGGSGGDQAVARFLGEIFAGESKSNGG